MKEGGGGDHLSVGVKLPRRGGIRPVSRKNLYQRPPGEYIVGIFSSFRIICNRAIASITCINLCKINNLVF